MNQISEMRLAEARAALESADLPDGSWSLGELRDDRPCLVLEGDEWVAGYVERGRFRARFRENDTGPAVARFSLWVQSIIRSTEASAAATTGWLRRTGKERP